jgi:DNA-binding transcriptional MocR family regulator
MHIAPFGVEIWMNEFEKVCELNLAETCVESITMAELLALCGKDESALSEVLPFKMTYGDIEGSDRLRAAIAALYEHQERENILVTLGTIGANSLIHQALISRGDKVVSVIPTYQQHYSIPESIGADVHTAPQLQREDDQILRCPHRSS